MKLDEKNTVVPGHALGKEQFLAFSMTKLTSEEEGGGIPSAVGENVDRNEKYCL
jgi:hypothetical protein